MDGATFWKTPISCSAIDKNPMSGHLFKGNPVEEGTTRRGTDTLVHRLEKPAGSTYSSTSVLSPLKNSRGKWGFIPLYKTRPDSPVPTLQGLCDPNQTSASEVTRGTLRFLPPLEIRTSSIARNPVESRETLIRIIPLLKILQRCLVGQRKRLVLCATGPDWAGPCLLV